MKSTCFLLYSPFKACRYVNKILHDEIVMSNHVMNVSNGERVPLVDWLACISNMILLTLYSIYILILSPLFSTQ